MRKHFEHLLDKIEVVIENALISISSNDVHSSRRWIDQYRFLRTILKFNFDTQLIENKSFSREEIDSANRRLTLQAEAEEHIVNWLNRLDDHITIENLLKSEDGADLLIDTMLPLTWDFEKDLIFLFSKYAAKIASRLELRGQKNILIYGAVMHSIDSKYIQSIEDIAGHLASISTPPDHVACLEPLQLANNPKEIETIHKEIINFGRFYKTNDDTNNKFSMLWAEHKIRNAPIICSAFSANQFSDFFENKNVLIVCPGPSLNSDIQKIKLNRRKFTILAAAQACLALSQAEIIPDFICVIDPTDISYTLENVQMSKVKGSILLDTCHPNVLKACTPSNLIILGDKPHVYNTHALIDQPPFDFSGMGVLVTMFKMALGYNAATIGLMGADLSLSEGEYSGGYVNPHVFNSSKKSIFNDDKAEVFWSDASQRWFKKIYTESNSGDTIFTKQDYYLFIQALEETINSVEHKIKVLNFSRNGAKISGAKYVDFGDFSNKINTQKVSTIFTAGYADDRSKRIQDLLKLFNKLERSNLKFSRACNSALREFKRQNDTTKIFEKMIQILKMNSILAFVFKVDLEVFNMNTRLLDFGIPSKKISVDLISTFENKAKILRIDLKKSINSLENSLHARDEKG